MARPTNKEKRRKAAKELAANETLQAIFNEREQEIVSRWKASDNTESREACHFDIIALGELRDAIDAAGTD